MKDLSKEFHPVPKPLKRVKMPKGVNKVGKKTNEWALVREELIKQFRSWGITKCELRLEGCWVNNALGFAHLKKRRKLSKEDLYKVVLSCNPCHQIIEYDKNMENILQKVIDNRGSYVV